MCIYICVLCIYVYKGLEKDIGKYFKLLVVICLICGVIFG